MNNIIPFPRQGEPIYTEIRDWCELVADAITLQPHTPINDPLSKLLQLVEDEAFNSLALSLPELKSIAIELGKNLKAEHMGLYSLFCEGVWLAMRLPEPDWAALIELNEFGREGN